jgi:flagellum-specific peptidoglycan hydrolase FlgJ
LFYKNILFYICARILTYLSNQSILKYLLVMSNFTHTSDNRRRVDGNDTNSQDHIEKNLWKLLIVAALTYLIWSDKVSINFISGSADSETELVQPEGKSVKAGLFSTSKRNAKPKKATIKVQLPANALNNVTAAIDPDFGDRNNIEQDAMELRTQKCREYVKRFAPIAVAEKRKFGIPASITLAQGLLESNAGESKLAKTTNNHFGMKCFSRSCRKGHCTNYTDDTHKDFFKKYTNVWGSFRAHSEFLEGADRYNKLFKLPANDYEGWARGLSSAGYALDKKYAEKLIAIIQSLGLDKYDNLN